MFKKYSIVLQYEENFISIFIIKYTGIRYKSIDFVVRKKGKRYNVDKEYEQYMDEFNIRRLIRNGVEIHSEFTDYNKNQVDLEFVPKSI